MSQIAIIIPAYNERDNLKNLVQKIKSIIQNPTIFIIDDSKDSMKDIFIDNDDIQYVHRGLKMGRGSAVLEGLKLALNNEKFSQFVEMDADFSHNPEELTEKLLLFSKTNTDLLISSRYLKGSKIINWPLSRKYFSLLSNLLVNIFLKLDISDYTNGFRVYSRRAAEITAEKCGQIGDDFIVLSEILLRAHQHKLKITEKPTIFVNRLRGESSVNIILIIKSLIGLFKLVLIKYKLMSC